MKIFRGQRVYRRSDRGYVLLTLLLTMAILVIAASIVASSISFDIKRDREEELIHRGVQYTRAIRAYSKKTGRYPMRLEELDDVNGLRFLRKHYKDPITGKDFKLVYMSQVVTFGPPPAQTLMNLNGAPGFNATTSPRNNGAEPANSSNDQTQSSAPGDSSQPAQPDPPSKSQNSGRAVSDTGSGSDQLHPAGMIVGVVSASKDKTIREFNGKNHYDQYANAVSSPSRTYAGQESSQTRCGADGRPFAPLRFLRAGASFTTPIRCRFCLGVRSYWA